MELLVVIGIIGILASLLLPTLARGKDRVRRVQCQSNLRQLGFAIYLYADEHERRLPSAERRPTNPVFPTNIQPRICDVLSNYVAGVSQVFLCPRDNTGYFQKEGSSYEWNYSFNRQLLDQLLRPGGEVSAEEAPLMYDYENVHTSGRGNTKNVFYADGHVDLL